MSRRSKRVNSTPSMAALATIRTTRSNFPWRPIPPDYASAGSFAPQARRAAGHPDA